MAYPPISSLLNHLSPRRKLTLICFALLACILIRIHFHAKGREKAAYEARKAELDEVERFLDHQTANLIFNRGEEFDSDRVKSTTRQLQTEDEDPSIPHQRFEDAHPDYEKPVDIFLIIFLAVAGTGVFMGYPNDQALNEWLQKYPALGRYFDSTAGQVGPATYQIAKAGEELGQMSVAAIRKMIATGGLTPEDYFLDAMANEWRPLRELSGL